MSETQNDCSLPLISFLLISYNQEEFIADAINSALNQNYSRLEIIISDDASTDKTFRIIEDLTYDYSGPHKVIIKRHSANVGIAENINYAMGLCSGELVVVAAGDDVSHPDRTSAIYTAWNTTGRKALTIFSSYELIDKNSVEIGLGGTRQLPANHPGYGYLQGDMLSFVYERHPVVNGCANAWSRKLFDYFGPLTGDLEDTILSFRSLSIGSMLYIDKPLVKYRRHDSNISFFGRGETINSFSAREKRLASVNEKAIKSFDNMVADLNKLYSDKVISETDYQTARVQLLSIRDRYSLELELLRSRLFKRLTLLIKAAVSGRIKDSVRLLSRALPRSVYRNLYLLHSRLLSQTYK